MELCNDFKQVTISSTAGATVVLSTAVAGRVPCLNRLEVGSTAANILRIQSVTTAGTTAELTGKMGMAAKTWYSLPFEPRVQGCLRGLAGGNLQLGSTSTFIDGFAIVSWTTIRAT